jgi:hypothetical protein
LILWLWWAKTCLLSNAWCVNISGEWLQALQNLSWFLHPCLFILNPCYFMLSILNTLVLFYWCKNRMCLVSIFYTDNKYL